MGNDGGSILKRADMVKLKPQKIKVADDLINKARAKYCALTKARLKKPIAACILGFLYDYEELLKGLMEKTLPPQFRYIRKLKDIKKLNFQTNEDINSDYIIVCPISLKEYNGMIRFQFNWKCGCVVSESAAQTNDQKSCINCGESIDQVISLNQTQEEQTENKNKVLDEQGKSVKKHTKKVETSEIQPLKKVKIDMNSNILDKLSTLQKKTENYNGMFHKGLEDYETEDANNLFFRNVRNGLR